MSTYYNYFKQPLLLLSIFAMLVFSSCKKYLDEKSNSTLVVPTLLTDYQAILDDASQMNFRQTPSFGETSADDYFLTADAYDELQPFEQHVYLWMPDAYYFQNDWSIGYLAVYNSNLSLEGVNKIDKTSSNEAAWNNVKGSALFFRAYNFLNLAWVYAKAYDESTANVDFGIALRTSSDFNILSVRTTVKATYDQVLMDAKAAADLLPDDPQQVVRPSRAAAFGLLARTYLSMGKYDSAYRYADRCLSIKNSLLDYNSPANVFKKYNGETIFYSEMNSFIQLYAPYSAYIDSTLTSGYASNDLRKTLFFNKVDDYFQFKGNYTASPNTLFTGIATDEMYLVRAECSARKGMTNDAMNDLNTLLIKRWVTGTYMPLTASTPTEALTYILQERRKELLMRGIRWYDIKRLNKTGANIIPARKVEGVITTLPPNDKRYALPLPSDIINLTGIPQN